jgi:UPF0271 protein
VARMVNLNADMGEGFGAYDIGHDEDLLGVIRSASIACGFHAGDFNTMVRLCQQAKERGVSVGAHPGFNDLWGFGRRRIQTRARDLEYMIAYQVGALQALASYAGVEVTHMKPHGALNNMAAEDLDYAMAIGRALKVVDERIIYVALTNSKMQEAAETLGLPLACEAFCDRLYEDDGNLTSRAIEGAVINEAVVARERVVEMVTEQVVIARSGKRLPTRIDTLCIHGDEPTSLGVAEAVRDGLEQAGVTIVPLTEMQLA